MRRQTVLVFTMMFGLAGAGCSLPQVSPLVAGPTAGPSPYVTLYPMTGPGAVTESVEIKGNDPTSAQYDNADDDSVPSGHVTPLTEPPGNSDTTTLAPIAPKTSDKSSDKVRY